MNDEDFIAMIDGIMADYESDDNSIVAVDSPISILKFENEC